MPIRIQWYGDIFFGFIWLDTVCVTESLHSQWMNDNVSVHTSYLPNRKRIWKFAQREKIKTQIKYLLRWKNSITRITYIILFAVWWNNFFAEFFFIIYQHCCQFTRYSINCYLLLLLLLWLQLCNIFFFSGVWQKFNNNDSIHSFIPQWKSIIKNSTECFASSDYNVVEIRIFYKKMIHFQSANRIKKYITWSPKYEILFIQIIHRHRQHDENSINVRGAVMRYIKSICICFHITFCYFYIRFSLSRTSIYSHVRKMKAKSFQ